MSCWDDTPLVSCCLDLGLPTGWWELLHMCVDLRQQHQSSPFGCGWFSRHHPGHQPHYNAVHQGERGLNPVHSGHIGQVNHHALPLPPYPLYSTTLATAMPSTSSNSTPEIPTCCCLSAKVTYLLTYFFYRQNYKKLTWHWCLLTTQQLNVNVQIWQYFYGNVFTYFNIQCCIC